jgi:hypothetical protein
MERQLTAVAFEKRRLGSMTLMQQQHRRSGAGAGLFFELTI